MTATQYINAVSLDQVFAILSDPRQKPKIVAGATDLMLEIERGMHSNLNCLVDISRIRNLDNIHLDNDGNIHIGPLVTHNDCVSSPLIRQYAPLLAMAAWEVGSPQIRNRGTIVGNLVTASPANDTIPPLMALNAKLKLVSPKSSRIVPLSTFYKGVRSTQLGADEIVMDIMFKGMTPNQKGIFIKFALRKAQAISVANVAILLDFSGQIINQATIALGAVAPTIIRAENSEAFLIGKSLSEEIILEAAKLAAQVSKPINDIRASASFRRWITQVITRRALEAIRVDDLQTRIPQQPALLRAKQKFSVTQSETVELSTRINGKDYYCGPNNSGSLLDYIRNEVGLIGSKKGCAEGECGTCTVYLDGAAVMSCLVPAQRALGAEIVTIEGIATSSQLHPVQQAFIDSGAVQCGYCTPGLIMSSVKLLEEIPNPSKNQITQALTGNLCRCTGYYKIIEAVEKAVLGEA